MTACEKGGYIIRDVKTLLICGGGNGMHAVVSAASRNPGCRVRVFAPFGSEASQLCQKLKEDGGIRACGVLETERTALYQVTEDPAEAAGGADMVLMVLPAFAHGVILSRLAPYLEEGVRVGAMPARSGFKYQACRILTDQGPSQYTVFGLQTLPWACRLKNFGSEVEILGVKRSVGMAAIPRSNTGALCGILTRILGVAVNPVHNMLALSLANVGQIVHPGIMYGLFREYAGEPFQEKDIPLFYSGVNDEIVNILVNLSNEIQSVKEKLHGCLQPEIHLDEVPTLEQWLLDTYGDQIEDKSTLTRAFQSNRAYRGLKAPVKKMEDGKFVPDFHNRYLVEDVPAGLLVTCALARLAGLSTPVMDRVVTATSSWMGKDYMRDGALTGSDISEVRIPQNYGINDLEALKSLVISGKYNY